MSEEELKRMNPWKRKAWSTRVRRWLKMMPKEMLEANPWEKSTKMRVKEWVKDNVGKRGEDDGQTKMKMREEKEAEGDIVRQAAQ